MTSRTRAKDEATQRIVEAVGRIHDRADEDGRRWLLRAYAMQLTGRMTLDELLEWEARLAKAEEGDA